MSEIPLCTIVISAQVPTPEIESLETSLRMSSIKVQKSPSRIVGADDIVFLATVLGGMAATANLIEYGIKVAKAIARNRKESQGIVLTALRGFQKPAPGSPDERRVSHSNSGD